MDSARWVQIQTVLDRALDKPAGQRVEFLAEALQDAPADFEIASSLVSESDQEHAALERSLEMLMDPHLVLPNPRIGRYRLLHRIGEGGSGVVYRAVREDKTTNREAAVKVLHWSLLNAAAARTRFLSEIRKLSCMNHPYIAHLYSWSQPDEATNWFSMELIDGVPVTAYCEREGLSLNRRLELFRKICQAVACAHEHLVLHLDLSPRNILVMNDGNPKLLDFGIAKSIGEMDALENRGLGYSFMTLLYASPEQISGGELSTRSDVFSLAVLLYEMITGKNPMESRAAQSADAGFIDPIASPVGRPSAAFSAFGRTSFRKRLQDRHRLWEIRKDLDRVVLKALAEDPAARYGTVRELEDDIANLLKNRPLTGTEGQLFYRSQKFAFRNPAMAIATCLIVLAGAAFTVLQQRHLTLQELERQHTRTAHEFLLDVFAGADPTVNGGEQWTAREMLDRAADRAISSLSHYPLVRASVLTTAGRAYGNLGDLDQARRLLEKGLRIRREELGAGHPLEAESLNELGDISFTEDDIDQAESLFRKALAIRQDALPDSHPDLAASLNNIGWVLLVREQLEQAQEFFEEGLRVRGRTPREEIPLLNGLGNVYLTRGQYAEAERLFEQALELDAEFFGERHPWYAQRLKSLGRLRLKQHNYEGAEKILRRVLELETDTLGKDHPQLAPTLNDLALAEKELGRLEQAEAYLKRSLALEEKTASGRPTTGVAIGNGNLAKLLRVQGRYEEALEHLERAIVTFQLASGDRSIPVAFCLTIHAKILQDMGKVEGALKASEEAVSIARTVLEPESPDLASVLTTHASVLLETGAHAPAEASAREALQIRRNALPEGNIDSIRSASFLGEILLYRGELTEAKELLTSSEIALKNSPFSRDEDLRDIQRRLELLRNALKSTGTS